MRWGICKNCNEFKELTRQHVLHKSQGGEGSYVQMVCRECHDGIERNTENVAKGILTTLQDAVSGSKSISTISAVNSSTLTTEARVGNPGSFVFDDKAVDIRVYYLDGVPVPKENVLLTGSISCVVAGSPTSTSPVCYFKSYWQ